MTGDGEHGSRQETCGVGPLEAAVAGLVRQEVRDLARDELDQLIRRAVREVLGDRTAGEPETLPKAAAARAVGVSAATIDRWQRGGRLARGHRGRVNMGELRALLAGERKVAPEAVDLAAHRARRLADEIKRGGRG